jgi:hypothetical protein
MEKISMDEGFDGSLHPELTREPNEEPAQNVGVNGSESE